MERFIRKQVDPEYLPPTIVEKWSQEILNEGFVPVPKRLLRCLPNIFDGPTAAEQIAVILAIADFRRPNLTRLPSVGYLAFVTGLPEKTFLLRLRELRDKGLVSLGGTKDAADIKIDGLLKRVEELTGPESWANEE